MYSTVVWHLYNLLLLFSYEFYSFLAFRPMFRFGLIGIRESPTLLFRWKECSFLIYLHWHPCSIDFYVLLHFAKIWYRTTWSKLICLSEKTVHISFRILECLWNVYCFLSFVSCVILIVLYKVKMLELCLNRNNTS